MKQQRHTISAVVALSLFAVAAQAQSRGTTNSADDALVAFGALIYIAGFFLCVMIVIAPAFIWHHVAKSRGENREAFKKLNGHMGEMAYELSKLSLFIRNSVAAAKPVADEPPPPAPKPAPQPKPQPAPAAAPSGAPAPLRVKCPECQHVFTTAPGGGTITCPNCQAQLTVE